MDENAKARDPAEQAAITRQLSGFSCGHSREDWPDPLREPCEPAQDELDLLQSKVAGHRWNGWRRLTGDEGYFAVCSCGWRSTETGSVSPMLRQVKEHFDAIRVVRGWRPATWEARAPGRDERERDAGQREMRQERTRELYASVESQQRRLSQALGTQVIAVRQRGPGRSLRGSARVRGGEIAPEWARTRHLCAAQRFCSARSNARRSCARDRRRCRLSPRWQGKSPCRTGLETAVSRSAEWRCRRTESARRLRGCGRWPVPCMWPGTSG